MDPGPCESFVAHIFRRKVCINCHKSFEEHQLHHQQQTQPPSFALPSERTGASQKQPAPARPLTAPAKGAEAVPPAAPSPKKTGAVFSLFSPSRGGAARSSNVSAPAAAPSSPPGNAPPLSAPPRGKVASAASATTPATSAKTTTPAGSSGSGSSPPAPPGGNFSLPGTSSHAQVVSPAGVRTLDTRLGMESTSDVTDRQGGKKVAHTTSPDKSSGPVESMAPNPSQSIPASFTTFSPIRGASRMLGTTLPTLTTASATRFVDGVTTSSTSMSAEEARLSLQAASTDSSGSKSSTRSPSKLSITLSPAPTSTELDAYLKLNPVQRQGHGKGKPASAPLASSASSKSSTSSPSSGVATSTAPAQLGVHVALLKALRQQQAPNTPTTEELCAAVVKPATSEPQCTFIDLLLDNQGRPGIHALAELANSIMTREYAAASVSTAAATQSTTATATSNSAGKLAEGGSPSSPIQAQEQITAPLVGEATCFVIHSWKAPFEELVETLAQYEASHPNTYFWIDVFVHNQHVDASSQQAEWWGNVFKKTIRGIGSVVLVLAPWNKPLVLTRLWCLFEIATAVLFDEQGAQGHQQSTFTSPTARLSSAGVTSTVTGATPGSKESRSSVLGVGGSSLTGPGVVRVSSTSGSAPTARLSVEVLSAQREQFKKAMSKNFSQVVQSVLTSMDVDKADATLVRDKAQILQVVKIQYKGGSVALTEAMKIFVSQWYWDKFLQVAGEDEDADAFFAAGNHFMSLGEGGKAATMLQHCVDIRERLLGETHVSTSMAYNALAQAFDAQGDQPSRALLYFEKDLAAKLAHPPPSSSTMGTSSVAATSATPSDATVKGRSLPSEALITTDTVGENVDAAITMESPSVLSSSSSSPSSSSASAADTNLSAKSQSATAPPAPLHPSLAGLCSKLGRLCMETGDSTKALYYLEQSLATDVGLLAGEPPSLQSAATYAAMADICKDNGKLDVAEQYLSKCLDIRLQRLGDSHPTTAATYFTLSCVIYLHPANIPAHLSRAIECLETCQAIRTAVHGVSHPDTMACTFALGIANALAGSVDGAGCVGLRSLGISSWVGGKAAEMGTALSKATQVPAKATTGVKKARDLLAKCIQHFGSSSRPGPSASLLLASAHYELGLVHTTLGDPSLAMSSWEVAVSCFTASVGEKHQDTAMALFRLGQAHSRQSTSQASSSAGDKAKAKQLFGRAAAVLNAVLGPEDLRTKEARKCFVEMHAK